MKRLILVVSVLVALVVLPACKFNGEATIIVKNVGELAISVEIEGVRVSLTPGEQEQFDLSWPGNGDINTNISYYALAYRETLWDSINMWISDGDTELIEVEFYPPEITK